MSRFMAIRDRRPISSGSSDPSRQERLPQVAVVKERRVDSAAENWQRDRERFVARMELFARFARANTSCGADPATPIVPQQNPGLHAISAQARRRHSIRATI